MALSMLGRTAAIRATRSFAPMVSMALSRRTFATVYTDDHEWISDPVDSVVSIGITDFAQNQLGDVVYVELPEVGAT